MSNDDDVSLIGGGSPGEHTGGERADPDLRAASGMAGRRPTTG